MATSRDPMTRNDLDVGHVGRGYSWVNLGEWGPERIWGNQYYLGMTKNVGPLFNF